MLTWSEKPNKYIAAAGVHLTAKSKDAIILTADIDISIGQQYSGPIGTIHHVRIRSIWSRKEELYSINYKTDFRCALPAKYGSTPVNSVDEIKEYCEMRWEEWLASAGVYYPAGPMA